MKNKSLTRYIFIILATASMALTTVVAKQKNQPRTDNGREVSATENGNSKVAKQQGRRVALLIGNSHYSKLMTLNNPKNDVALMERTLRELGFTEIIGGTQRGLDLSYADMQELLEEFSKKSSLAEVAVIFFAGHGLVTKSGNEQYLAGVETTGREDRLPAEALSLIAVMDKLSSSGAEKNFVFLDACRTTARGGGMRSITLKRDAPNTVILYATAADNTAADGQENTNSPFTKALAAEIKQPNEWAVVQRNVVNRVFKETQEQQEPKSYGNFKEEMYFNVTVNPGPAATELAFWDSIKNSTDIADFDEYKNKYPQGTFIGLANNRIRQLKANASTTSRPPVSPAVPVPVIAKPPIEIATTCTDCPELVTLPSGTFQMGSNDSDSDDDEKPIHSVSIKSFAIGKYEVTQGQWKSIMGSNPSYFSSCGDTCPVEKVSWDDIQIYLQKLNQKTGQKYRLPTEAEWEYACRGGKSQKYCGSDDVGSVAWYYDNSKNKTHPVGKKAPNAFGLYDMSGNVWEWVQDGKHSDYNGAPTDGSEWVTGASSSRVLRGGSWSFVARFSRAAIRDIISPVSRFGNYGFRVARTAP